MSASDLAAGYPVHAVATFRNWSNEHGARFVDWTATCGEQGSRSGSSADFGTAGQARKRELCPTCWPTGHSTYHPAPRELSGK